MIWLFCAVMCLYGFFGTERGWLGRHAYWAYVTVTMWTLWATLSGDFIQASCLVLSGLLFHVGAMRYEDR